MNLKDKVVIVTGASSGIGEATAIRFAKEGARVIVNYKSNSEAAKKVLTNIEKTSEGIIVQADVSKPNEVDNLFKQTLDKYGKVDILINNAGISDEPDFLKAKLSDWQEMFNNDLFSTMLCSQHAIKIMSKQGSGKITNTASLYGLDYAGREGLTAYSASKAAMINFTKTLAKLVAPKILVNAVAPGYVKTPAWEGVPEETTKRYINRTYLKRWITSNEIAEAFIYLATADAITGQVLVVDAGRSLMDY